MKLTVDFPLFEQLFKNSAYRKDWSTEGLEHLFDYLEQVEEDTGEEIECDVVALCAEFTEYGSAVEAWRGLVGDEPVDEADALTYLEENGAVVDAWPGGIIVTYL